MLRRPAHAGTFYPAEPGYLEAIVREFLEEGEPVPGTVAVLSPHAGYPFSGKIAGIAHRALAWREIKRVVILGVPHYVPVQGVAVWPEGIWQTPLGELLVDSDAAAQLLAQPGFEVNYDAHVPEHSVEVQLPFVQVLFPEVKILPAIVGPMDAVGLELAAQALLGILDEGTAVVVSSDLYHGYSYEECKRRDRRTLEHILSLDPDRVAQALASGELEACGAWGILLWAKTFEKLGGEAELLAYTNSAEVTGNFSGYVVGYGAVAFKALSSR